MNKLIGRKTKISAKINDTYIYSLSSIEIPKTLRYDGNANKINMILN